ncbi:MAG TPA: carbohydrate kinase [Hanamia sp.]|nr:carbohydrate kinase [Hanamia sp.]
MTEKSNFPVVCFGEILWDFLPKGKMPGGAPVNVAYHLKQLGKNPAIITRIGNDDLGKELEEVFSKKNLDTRFFQKDDEHETGKVYATLKEDNEVEYEIVQPVAWDFIETNDETDELSKNADYFIYGSLASRNKNSHNSLLHCLELAKTKVLDINLRPPHFSKEVFQQLIKHADILKLNLSELHLISGWFDELHSDEERIKMVAEKFNLKTIIVTKGGNGAMLFKDQKFYYHPGYSVEVADTVGSGDAFLAAIISKLMDKSSPSEALDFAAALGAFVASRSGACPDYEMNDVLKLMNDPKAKN